MFEDLLIAAMKRYPCIYDKGHSGYRNKAITEMAWKSVSIATKRPVSHCRSRWKSLRDRYVREMNDTESDRPVWMYMAAMSFMKKFVKKRGTNTRLRDDYFMETTMDNYSIEDLFEVEDEKEPKNESTDMNNYAVEDIFIVEKEHDEAFENEDIHTETISSTKHEHLSEASEAEDHAEVEVEAEEVADDFRANTSQASTSQAAKRQSVAKAQRPTQSHSQVHPLSQPKLQSTELTNQINGLRENIGNLNQLINANLIKESKNEAFYRFIESFMVKLDEREQDKLKVDVVNLVARRLEQSQRNEK
uniref:Transcription factor Adf-1 n=1 Tax=Ceratitis capitata TaxID=7213 RepID=W8CD92_CERCA